MKGIKNNNYIKILKIRCKRYQSIIYLMLPLILTSSLIVSCAVPEPVNPLSNMTSEDVRSFYRAFESGKADEFKVKIGEDEIYFKRKARDTYLIGEGIQKHLLE